MKKPFLAISLLVLLLACDTTFRVKKIITESNNRVITETYLVSNVNYSPKVTDSILLNTIVKHRLKEVYKVDNNIVKFVVSFYDNTPCSRRYFKNYKHLKGIEHITENCGEDIYIETFIYEKSNKHHNMWNLKYSKDMKDTVYCN